MKTKEQIQAALDRSKQAIDDMLAIYWSDALDREETLDGIAEILINFEADDTEKVCLDCKHVDYQE